MYLLKLHKQLEMQFHQFRKDRREKLKRALAREAVLKLLPREGMRKEATELERGSS